MLRSILAAVAGFMLWTVLWLGLNALLANMMPDSFNEDGSTDSSLLLVFILALSVVFSVVAGYATSWIVIDGSAWSVWAMGIALLAVGLFVQISFWTHFPIWYHVLFLGLLIPAVLTGAQLSQ
jgi:hypothetical protein